MKTAIDLIDEKLQGNASFIDYANRSLVIKMSMEEYMNLKREAKAMFRQQIENAARIGFGAGIEYNSTPEMAEKFAEKFYTTNYGE